MAATHSNWHLPLDFTHHLAGSAGTLSFVGGAGDFGADGRIVHPGDLFAQIEGTLRNTEVSLQVESCSLDDVVRLKAFYRSDGSLDEWQVLAALAKGFSHAPLPVISLIPVLMQPFQDQEIQVQVIAQRGWRSFADVRVDSTEIPHARRSSFRADALTSGLRAGEFIAVANRTALDLNGEIAEPDDGIAQTRLIMSSIENTLSALGASFQDAVKKEGCYFGTTREQWAGMAKQRAAFFREPGPVATIVPCQVLWPTTAQTKIEVLAMRQVRGGFDKYIPRDDSWPSRVWDWPIPLPYRQASRLRDMIWLGGQVPSQPFNNAKERVLAGQLGPQTAFTMSYIDDLLRGFGRSAADLKLAVCYFKSDGSEETTRRFVKTLQECVGGALPPLTLVPQPQMHTPENTVEIWGVAAA